MNELDKKDDLIRRLAEHLSCILDYSAEGNCGRLVGFAQAYREANAVCGEAYEYMEPAEEAEYLAELNRGYAQDRI